MPTWPRQLARVERWLARIEDQPGDLGRAEPVDVEDLSDDHLVKLIGDWEPVEAAGRM